MARAGYRRSLVALALGCLAAGCGPPGAGGPEPGLRLSFEDRAQPEVFRREAMGRRDAPGGAAGSWAVVPGLPRPERALVENLESGASTTVALFAGGGSRGEVRLSAEAADALGIGGRPAPVRVTALRSEPQVRAPRDGF